MRFLRRLHRAWRFTRRQPEMPVKVPEWTDVDARALRAFMQGETGRKLGVMLRHLLIDDALGAMGAKGDSLPWRCGHASGVQTAVITIDQLARWEEAPVNPKDDRPKDDLAWLHGNQTDGDNDRNE